MPIHSKNAPGQAGPPVMNDPPKYRKQYFLKRSTATVFFVVTAAGPGVPPMSFEAIRLNHCVILWLPIMPVLLAKSGCGCPADSCAHYRVSAYTLPKCTIKNVLIACDLQ